MQINNISSQFVSVDVLLDITLTNTLTTTQAHMHINEFVISRPQKRGNTDDIIKKLKLI